VLINRKRSKVFLINIKSKEDLFMNTMTSFKIFAGTNSLEFLDTLFQGSNPPASSPNNHEHDDGEACIANISPQERLKRLIGGLIPFVLALGILTWQISSDVNRLWRLPLFILFVSAASGFFQWRDKT